MEYVNNISNLKFLTTGIKSIEKGLFNPIENIEYSNRPKGGLWSSPYREFGDYRSDWLRFCIEEDFLVEKTQSGILFTLKPETKICIIDSMDDLEKLYNNYKGKNTNSILYRRILDFEKLSLDYDAIYLTNEGECQTRYPRTLVGSDDSISLYGWDVETLLVMNLDCIKEWEYINLK